MGQLSWTTVRVCCEGGERGERWGVGQLSWTTVCVCCVGQHQMMLSQSQFH